MQLVCHRCGFKNRVSSTRYGIRSIPTLILFKRGQEQARLSGALKANELKQWIESTIHTAQP